MLMIIMMMMMTCEGWLNADLYVNRTEVTESNDKLPEKVTVTIG